MFFKKKYFTENKTANLFNDSSNYLHNLLNLQSNKFYKIEASFRF